MTDNDSFAFSTALALESVDSKNFSGERQVYEFTPDQLVGFATTIAYKTFHNVQSGFKMDSALDPILVDGVPAREAWANHYQSADSSGLAKFVSKLPDIKILPDGSLTTEAFVEAFTAEQEGTPFSLGEVVYTAYCKSTNWKSVYSGADLPEYSHQRPEVIAAWEAGAMALVKMFSNFPVPQDMSFTAEAHEGPIGNSGCCGGPEGRSGPAGYDPESASRGVMHVQVGDDNYEPSASEKEAISIDPTEVGSVENVLGLSPESDEEAGDITYAIKA